MPYTSLNNFFDLANQQVQNNFQSLLTGNPKVQAKYHSGKYFGPDSENGIYRTVDIPLTTNPNPGQGQVSPAVVVEPPLGEIRPLPGFTPIQYYTREYDTYKGRIKAIQFVTEGFGAKSGYSLDLNAGIFNNGVLGELHESYNKLVANRDKTSADFISSLQSYDNVTIWPDEVIPSNPINYSVGLQRENFTGRFESKPWLSSTHNSGGKGTPYENEDPVFFGFEVVIDGATSPLFNGEVLDFIIEIGGGIAEKRGIGNTEIFNRKPLLDSFCFEAMKYFKFKNDPYIKNKSLIDAMIDREDGDKKAQKKQFFDNLMNYDLYQSVSERKHYVKKIEGLDFLNEKNAPGKPSGFVKYNEDTIKLTFYEDITLTTGAFMNLYKLLAWSRISGKSMIPDNLLKFDCEIIITEVRNMARVRTAIKEATEAGGGLETTQPGDFPANPETPGASSFFSETNTDIDATSVQNNPITDPVAGGAGSQFSQSLEQRAAQFLTNLNGDVTGTAVGAGVAAAGVAGAGGTSPAVQPPLAPPAPAVAPNPLFPNAAAAAAAAAPAAAEPPVNAPPTPTTGQRDKEKPPGGDSYALQIIKDNLSRYRYKLYECQFYVPTLPHPTSIDLGAQLTSYDAHTIEISFKHTELSFEKFDYKNLVVPISPDPSSPKIIDNSDGFGRLNPSSNIGKYFTIDNGLLLPYSSEEGNVATIVEDNVTGQDSIGAKSTQIEIVELNSYETRKTPRRQEFIDGLKRAGQGFAQQVKRIALSEIQKKINDESKILNDTLFKVKQAYGLGQISPPKNVYEGIDPNVSFGISSKTALENAVKNFAGGAASAGLGLG
jgi:hypothetical protein